MAAKDVKFSRDAREGMSQAVKGSAGVRLGVLTFIN